MVGVAHHRAGAIGAVVARFVHTEEVTGSNPVSPTQVSARFTPMSGSIPAHCQAGLGGRRGLC